jgi:hypothetical protein
MRINTVPGTKVTLSSLKKLNGRKKEELNDAGIISSLPAPRKNGKKSVFTAKHSHQFFNGEHNFFHEPFFHKMLNLEQKRSERSQKQFLLILIDIQRLVMTENTNDTVTKFIQVLNWVSRDTDIKGWYETNKAIGIVYTGISFVSIKSVVEKVKIEIANTFDVDQAAAIDVAHYLLPDFNALTKNTLCYVNRDRAF